MHNFKPCIRRFLTLIAFSVCIALMAPAIVPVLAQEAYIIRIVLRPAVANYTDEEMETSLEIIRQRLEDLGYEDVEVARAMANSEMVLIVRARSSSTIDKMLLAVTGIGLLEFVDFANLATNIEDGTCIVTDEQVRLGLVLNPGEIDEDRGEDLPTLCPDGSLPLGRDGTPQGEMFHTIMTGTGLEDTSAAIDPNTTQWLINFTLTREGSEIFAAHTSANIGKKLAIVLDGVVLSAPTIQARIEGRGVITGNFSEDEAKTLAAQLRFGVLPFRPEVISVKQSRAG